MGQTLTAIRFDRLLLALLLTFLVVDTYPHPSLGSGLIERLIRQGTANLRLQENTSSAIVEP